MIATCPSCGARFEIESAAVPSEGRDVRCGKCSYVWHFSPEDAEEEAASPAADDSAPVLPETPPPGLALAGAPNPASDTATALPTARPSSSLLLGWLALAVFVAVVLAGGWFGRETLIEAVPQAARVYALLGLNSDEPLDLGLELTDVRASREIVDSGRALVIRGAVQNISDEERGLPELQASITDGQGAVLAEWRFAAASEVLPAGERIDFETMLVDPPGGNINISVVFANSEQGR